MSQNRKQNASRIESPWGISDEEILEKLDVNPRQGLTDSQAASRQKTYGQNVLRKKESTSAWTILLNQFKSLIIILLAGASGLSLAFGEIIEGIAVFFVIVINTAIGFFTEIKAVRSMEALREISQVDAVVRRNGKEKTIAARELVPGDIVVLQGGDVVTADIRITQASKLQANESTLTGESIPVEKNMEPTEKDAPLAERTNMLFKGTAVARGSAEGVVVATGTNTELGQISDLVEEAQDEVTPLEKRLDSLARRLIWIALVLTAAIAVTGIVRGEQTLLMIRTAVVLAVAAIPEGFPIVSTIALARGMWRMAQRNALINKLASVETLGATSIICTDKTGTLTLNKMTLDRIRFLQGGILFREESEEKQENELRKAEEIDWQQETLPRQAVLMGVLCSNASLTEEDEEQEGVGDPLEVALLVAGKQAGIRRKEALEQMPEEREDAFDSRSKMMATFHNTGDGYLVAIKGAPEAVLPNCSRVLTEEGEREFSEDERDSALQMSESMAGGGLRVLAVGQKKTDSTEVDPYEGMSFIGLIGLFDPPRKDVREPIEMTREAGIRTIMVTGDQPQTAVNIALSVGLCGRENARVLNGREFPEYGQLSERQKVDLVQVPIFARVSPEQKLDIIALHQENHAVVAMTGDGVNDAPALKKADIGIAMGRRGTQVAREASDMILKDDAFSTIVLAIQQGRIIFSNIRAFLVYLLSCNVSEIVAVGIASLAGMQLPILPLQILFLNMVTEVFPALALGVGEGDPAVMEQPPRDPKESILNRPRWLAIAAYGTSMALTVIGALWVARGWLKFDEGSAVSVSFLTLAFAQTWHVFNLRSSKSSILNNDVTRNKFVWMAVLLCIVLIVLAANVPLLARIVSLTEVGIEGWATAILMSLIPLCLGQIGKTLSGMWK